VVSQALVQAPFPVGQVEEMAGRHAADNRMDDTLDLADYVLAWPDGRD
jgi:hypothetical protein